MEKKAKGSFSALKNGSLKTCRCLGKEETCSQQALPTCQPSSPDFFLLVDGMPPQRGKLQGTFAIFHKTQRLLGRERTSQGDRL
jgi:hypothetical protein